MIARGSDPAVGKPKADKAKADGKVSQRSVARGTDPELAAMGSDPAIRRVVSDPTRARAEAARAKVKAKADAATAKAQAALDKGPPLGKAVPVTLVTLYVPGVERDGTTSIDQAKWVEEALQCISRLFGRATAYPAGQGVFREGGSEMREKSVPIQCYAEAKALKDAKKRAELATFCRRMGQQTKQQEVGLVIGAHYHGIRIAALR